LTLFAMLIECTQYAVRNKLLTGWLKIEYPTRQYAISPQPVV